MARKNQKLINFHGAYRDGLEAWNSGGTALELGEIAVITNDINLAIIDSAKTLHYFIDSATTAEAIDTKQNELLNQLKSVSAATIAVSGSYVTFSGYVVENYATSADTVSADTAIKEWVSGLTVNAHKLGDAPIVLDGSDVKLGSTYTASGDININTATTIAAAISELVNVDDSLQTEVSILEASANTLSGMIETLSANTDAAITALSGAILTKIGTAYVYKGSVEDYSDLPTSASTTPPEVGHVYNVENAVVISGSTGEPVIEYPAHTNFAWNGTSWDSLGGMVDLSAYMLKSSFASWSADVYTSQVTNFEDRIDKLELMKEKVGYDDTLSGFTYSAGTLSGELKAVSGAATTALQSVSAVGDTYVSAVFSAKENNVQGLSVSADVVTELSAATETAGQLADAKIVKQLSGETEEAIDSVKTSLTYLTNRIFSGVSEESAITPDNSLLKHIIDNEKVTAAALSDLDTRVSKCATKVVVSNLSGVTGTYDSTSGTVTIDYANMIVDCGSWD